MGSNRIKTVCFATDILDILGTDVCLYRELRHAFRLIFFSVQASEGVTLQVASRDLFTSELIVLLWTSLIFYELMYAYRELHHAFTLCFIKV